MDYDEYEKLCEKQREANDKYLGIFENDLKEASLKPKTIKDHLFNADFYINEYLLRMEPSEMQEGCGYKIDLFLGDFFIRKCMWSTPGTIKSTAASIKKFYKSMHEHGHVDQDSYRVLCDEIKESMGIWQADCEAYNNF
ncbi:hypothetical protein [Amphibacillus indicireducens]|uniref:Recombinase n=1 Tax=Amphibacillus indicireducens TaxID=1076330 RepID=A0ABP7V2Q6_9BACI